MCMPLNDVVAAIASYDVLSVTPPNYIVITRIRDASVSTDCVATVVPVDRVSTRLPENCVLILVAGNDICSITAMQEVCSSVSVDGVTSIVSKNRVHFRASVQSLRIGRR